MHHIAPRLVPCKRLWVHACVSLSTRRLLSSMSSPTDDAPLTIFDKIVAKTIPSTAVYEDELVYAFRDITPVAPTHILVIPKVRSGLTQLQKANESHKLLLGHLLWAAAEVARREGLAEGYRIVINDRPHGLQSGE